jgi:hypothetical protein
VAIGLVGAATVAVSGPVASAPSQTVSQPAMVAELPPMAAPPGGWVLVGDDHVVSGPGASATDRSATTSAEGEGFNRTAGVRGMLPVYTLRLRADATAEALRPYVVAAAAAVETITGADLVVAPGTTKATEAATAEILVDVTPDSPCGPLGTFGTVGCGGPSWWYDGLGDDNLISTGAIWITPEWQTLGEADRQGLVSHELGHALGLGHYTSDFEGFTQLMYPSLQGQGDYRSGDAAGLRSVWAGRPGPAYPFSRWEDFVAQQLEDFTGTRGTSTQQRDVGAKLRSGELDPATYISQLMANPWFSPSIAPLVRLYWAYFGRKPDNSGLRYWIAKRRSGTTLIRISQTFAASSEFIRKYGALTNRQFVTRIYTDVLGRTADTAGVNYWTGKLDRGTSRGQVMTNFSESSEYTNKMRAKVNAVLVYIGMVRSVPNAADLEAAQQKSLLTLIRHVQFSPDYGGRPQYYCALYCSGI